ncbi:S8 family serine peptidase [bacterium]|nr:S8 family serine peptidase [bacterium]
MRNAFIEGARVAGAVSLLSLAVCPVCAARAADGLDFTIRLANGVIEPMAAGGADSRAGMAGRAIAPDARSPEQHATTRGTVPMIVQFAGPVEEGWRRAVAGAGAAVHGYLPNHAFIVSARPESVDALASVAPVRWIGEYKPAYKISSHLDEDAMFGTKSRLRTNIDVDVARSNVAVRIITFTPADADQAAAYAAHAGATVLLTSRGPAKGYVRARATAAQIQEMARHAEVEWIEPYIAPRLHNDVSAQAPRMNAQTVWAAGLTGRGQIVGHADTGLDTGVNNATLHPDFTNRVKAAFGLTPGRGGAWSDLNAHGTHTAGSILGNGSASAGQFRGIAFEAQLVHQSVGDSGSSLPGLPDPIYPLYHQTYTNGARIHSDSWGSSAAGAYDAEAQNTDQYMWDYKDMLILFSAGNDGVDANGDGVVDPGSVGSPGTAKNVLTVGAAENARAPGSGGLTAYTWGQAWPADYPAEPVKSDYISRSADNVHQGMAAFSSRGPCLDGRVKPEIVGPGTDVVSCRSSATSGTGWGVYNARYLFSGGTSMSCPLCAGAAAVVRQYYAERSSHTNPTAALVKATLVNGARTLSYGQYGWQQYREIPPLPRPNNVEGWGQVDLAPTLLPGTGRTNIAVDRVTLATGTEHSYSLAVGGSNTLSVTLTWTDYPGTFAAEAKLVNDLDLFVIAPDGRTNHANGLVYGDRVNNVEGVDLDPAAAGVYTIVVRGHNVPQGPQPYALVMREGAPFTGPRLSIETNIVIVAMAGSTATVNAVMNNTGDSNLSFRLEKSAARYSWTDSTQPGGPAFEWINIVPTGADVTPLSDDGVAGPYAIGFPFVFYGTTNTQFWVGMNGGIMFQPGPLPYLNEPLPTASVTGSLIAAFWDDLDPSSDDVSPAIKRLSDSNQLVVSYLHVPRFGSPLSNIFQIVLRKTGEVLMQYRTVTGTRNSCTVGIQGSAPGDKAVEVVYNHAYVQSNLAVRFDRTPDSQWLSVSPQNGTIAAHGSAMAVLTATTAGLTDEVYTASFTAFQSSPYPPETVSVTLIIPEPLTLFAAIALLMLRRADRR